MKSFAELCKSKPMIRYTRIEAQISRLEKIVLVSAGMLIMGMANMIFMLLTK